MFQCQRGYTLQKIKGVSHLLPYGQQMADQKKGMILNETGTFLWNVIQHTEGSDPETLAEMLARLYGLGEEAFPEVLNDVNDFLSQMTALGMITESLKPISHACTASMKIAGLSINFYGPVQLLGDRFADFYVNHPADEPDQEIEFITRSPASHNYGQVLLRNSDMTIFENSDRYVVLFPQMSNIHEVHMTLDGSYVRFYCSNAVTDQTTENLFHALRLFFLFLAQRKGLFAIHSASILYREKAWLFSGHSGMGKSTHTGLWHQLLGTPFLNGDLNLLGIHENRIMVYGIPWCGTSGIYTTRNYELGGIVLLGRDPARDYLEELSPSDQILRVMQRMISPAWKEGQLTKNLFFAEEIADRVPILHLFCTKNQSAVKVIREEIDRLEVLHEK